MNILKMSNEYLDKKQKQIHNFDSRLFPIKQKGTATKLDSRESIVVKITLIALKF